MSTFTDSTAPVVRDTYDRLAALIGQQSQEAFANLVSFEWGEPRPSPIQQLLYLALLGAATLNGIHSLSPDRPLTGELMEGLSIRPSEPIGPYTVDFLLFLYEIRRARQASGEWGEPRQYEAMAVVDCDEWHERHEKDRRTDYARDRFLAASGYRVFHFTSMEILDDPLPAACEMLDCLMERPQGTCLENILGTP